MSRMTHAGAATVRQVCAAFGLSRAAYYAARRPARAPAARVVRLPRRPRHASAEAVLAAIRAVVDLTTTWTRRDGVVAIVPTLDCGCRSLLGLAVTTDQTGPAVLVSVETALVAAFGSPAAVPEGVESRSDHGPPYTGTDCAALVVR